MLSFPLTDFDAQDEYDAARIGAARWNGSPASIARRFSWPAAPASSSRSRRKEYSARDRQPACAVAGPRLPVIAGVGYGTKLAITFAQEAERLGADGLLLMPPYLTEGSQAGLAGSYRGGLQSHAARRHRLQPRQLPAHRADLGGNRRAVSQPDRLQGWRRRHRAACRHPRDGRRSAGLSQRHADGGNLRASIPRYRHSRLFVGDLQLRAAHGARLPSRGQQRRYSRRSIN